MEILYPLVALRDDQCLVDMAVLGFYDCQLKSLCLEALSYGYKCQVVSINEDNVLHYLKGIKRIERSIGPKTYQKLVNMFLWKALISSLRQLTLGHIMQSIIIISKTLDEKLADNLHETRLRLSLALGMFILARNTRAEQELSAILKKKHLAEAEEQKMLETVSNFLLAQLPTTNNSDKIKHLVTCCLKVGDHILHNKELKGGRQLLCLSLERLAKCTFDRQNSQIKSALIGFSLVLSDKLLKKPSPVMLYLQANYDKLQEDWDPRFRLAKYPRLSSLLLGLLIKFQVRKPQRRVQNQQIVIQCPDDLLIDRKQILLPPRIIKPTKVEKMKLKACTDVGKLLIKNKFLESLSSDTGHRSEIQQAQQRIAVLRRRVEEQAQPLEKLQGKVGTFILKLKNQVNFSKLSYIKKIRGWVLSLKFLVKIVVRFRKSSLIQKYIRKHLIGSSRMICLVNGPEPYIEQFSIVKSPNVPRIIININTKQLALLKLLPINTLIRILNEPDLFTYNLLTLELKINVFLKRLRRQRKDSKKSYKKYNVQLKLGQRLHTYILLVCVDRAENTTTIERLDTQCQNQHLNIRFTHKAFRILPISVPALRQIIKNLISRYWYSNSLAKILHVQRVAKVTKWIKHLKTSNLFKSVMLPGRYLITQYKVENGKFTCFVEELTKNGQIWQEYTNNRPYLPAEFFDRSAHIHDKFLSVDHVVRYLRSYVEQLIISKAIIKIRAKLKSRKFHRDHRDYFWKKFEVIDEEIGRTHLLLFSIRPQGIRNYQAEVFSCSSGLKLHITFQATRLEYGFLVQNSQRLGEMFELKGLNFINRIHTWQKFTFPRLSAAVKVEGLQIQTVASVASIANRTEGGRRQSTGLSKINNAKHTSWGLVEQAARRNTIQY